MKERKKRIGDKVKITTTGEAFYAYVPKPLPPDPPINMEKIYPLLDQANVALGRLDGLSAALPTISTFLYMYIRKEAVLSSQIEGTQSSLSDLLSYENHAQINFPHHDVADVVNYVAAMEHGLSRMRDGFPLSLRLILEMHEILLNQGRGSTKQPGEFRRSQNWIGGTRPGNANFVPPPPDKLMETLGALEIFLHDENVKLPTLIKAALAHHQFETIHPFLDGNSRLGRLLITFILCVEGLLQKPMLYLSLYFKTHRQSYYDHLQVVRDTGDWEEWIQFFLKGVIATANQAIKTIEHISKLFEEDTQKIKTLGKMTASVLTVYQYLQQHPNTGSKQIVSACHLSLPTAIKALKLLTKLGIAKEMSGRKRNQFYAYKTYLDLLMSEE